MNGCYIRNLSANDFHQLALPYYKDMPNFVNLTSLSATLQPRIETLNDILTQTDFLINVPEYDISLYENKKMKTNPEIALNSLELVIPSLENISEWTNENLFETLKDLAIQNELKNGQILYPVRIALSGKETTPGGATELAVILGKDETIQRIKNAISKLNK